MIGGHLFGGFEELTRLATLELRHELFEIVRTCGLKSDRFFCIVVRGEYCVNEVRSRCFTASDNPEKASMSCRGVDVVSRVRQRDKGTILEADHFVCNL